MVHRSFSSYYKYQVHKLDIQDVQLTSVRKVDEAHDISVVTDTEIKDTSQGIYLMLSGEDYCNALLCGISAI